MSKDKWNAISSTTQEVTSRSRSSTTRATSLRDKWNAALNRPCQDCCHPLDSPPEDKRNLQRFLGMTNYLAKFIPDYSEATAPLRELLRQDVDWCWLELHTAAFTKLKELIAGPPGAAVL